MKTYKVNVNGTDYEVTVELIENKAPTSAPQVAPAVGVGRITAPMPGTILSVNITPGQRVKKGDILMILEAMKMENEIMCPCDGTVVSIDSAKGASVEAGALLCVIG